MKKNDFGFTLVELMAVIIILGVIATIAYPLVTGTIGSSKEKLSKEQINSIIDAAKIYAVKEGHCGCVTIEALVDGGYLESVPVDPKNGSTIGGGVSLSWEKNQYQYDYDSSCNEVKIEECPEDKN